MVSHMKTTLNISDPVMKALRKEAQRSGKTMSALVETALRDMLATRPPRTGLPELPTFDGGRPSVNVANREALFDVMEPR